MHNARFAVAAKDTALAWRALPAGLDVTRVCSFRYEATVLKDNTVRLGGTIILDIPPGPRGRSYADRRVEVRQLLDGAWRVYLQDLLLATAPAPGELRARRRRKRGRGADGRAGVDRGRAPRVTLTRLGRTESLIA